MEFIFSTKTIEEAINLGYHYLLNSDDIFQCVQCNAFCDIIGPVISDITKEIICEDCFWNLF